MSENAMVLMPPASTVTAVVVVVTVFAAVSISMDAVRRDPLPSSCGGRYHTVGGERRTEGLEFARAMTAPRHHEYTFAEYVDLERDSATKHEFLDGEIYARSEEHTSE